MVLKKVPNNTPQTFHPAVNFLQSYLSTKTSPESDACLLKNFNKRQNERQQRAGHVFRYVLMFYFIYFAYFINKYFQFL